LPPGVSFLLGNDYTVMTDVRMRKSMHDGETQTSENYVEKTDVSMFKPGISVQEVESMYDEKFSTAYYPLYLVENDKKRLLVDGVNGDVKAERRIPSGLEKKVLQLLRKDKGKSEIVEELDMTVSKAASKIDSLEEKGLVEDGEVEESVLDKEISDEAVDAEDLIDFEVSEEEVGDRFDGDISEVRYSYYRSDDKVYDPILGEEI